VDRKQLIALAKYAAEQKGHRLDCWDGLEWAEKYLDAPLTDDEEALWVETYESACEGNDR